MRKNSIPPILIAILSILTLASGCTKTESPSGSASSGDATSSKGIGPISAVKLEALNPTLAATGKTIFVAKCSACHKFEERYVGPALKGVTGRRQPEWIMNMILNPAEMTQKDPVAKELLAEYMTQMSFQNVSQDEARQILEYFRQNDSAKGI